MDGWEREPVLVITPPYRINPDQVPGLKCYYFM